MIIRRLIIAHEAAGPQIYTVLSVLVQNVSYLIPAAQDFEVADAPMQCKVLDIRTEEEFWALIRLALVCSSEFPTWLHNIMCPLAWH